MAVTALKPSAVNVFPKQTWATSGRKNPEHSDFTIAGFSFPPHGPYWSLRIVVGGAPSPVLLLTWLLLLFSSGSRKKCHFSLWHSSFVLYQININKYVLCIKHQWSVIRDCTGHDLSLVEKMQGCPKPLRLYIYIYLHRPFYIHTYILLW